MRFPFSQPLPFPPREVAVPSRRLGCRGASLRHAWEGRPHPSTSGGPPRLARHPPTRAATDFLVRPAVPRLASRTKMVLSQQQVPGRFQGSCSLSAFCARGGGHVSSLSRA